MSDETLEVLAEKLNVKADILKLAEEFNPLKLYSKLIKLGFDKKYSFSLIQDYEMNIYNKIIDYITKNKLYEK